MILFPDSWTTYRARHGRFAQNKKCFLILGLCVSSSTCRPKHDVFSFLFRHFVAGFGSLSFDILPRPPRRRFENRKTKQTKQASACGEVGWVRHEVPKQQDQNKKTTIKEDPLYPLWILFVKIGSSFLSWILFIKGGSSFELCFGWPGY